MPSGQIMNPTMGALGNEKAKTRQRQRRRQDEDVEGEDREKRGRRRTKKDNPRDVEVNYPSTRNVKPAFTDAPKVPSDNLAGRPDALLRSDLGVKRVSIKHVAPYHIGNLNTESFLHFVVHSTAHEWIRFKKDSLSFVIWLTYLNDAYVAAAQDPKTATQYLANEASKSTQPILIDPDVMGTGFFSKVEVIINNVPVPTNASMGTLLQHYVRCNRVYSTKNKSPHFTLASQIDFTKDETRNSPVMKEAWRCFDYGAWSARNGHRMPIYLDGIFPFDLKCEMLQSLENTNPERLYLPPDTTLELKLHYNRTKMESIWHNELDVKKYFNESGTEAVDVPKKMKISIQSASLEYEAVELHPAQHMELLSNFKNERAAYYDYDIPRGQHQALAPGASTTYNVFQVMPFARLLVVMFMKDWSTFIMENTRRPLMGFSEFPKNATKIKLEYAGESYLVTEQYDRFGVRGEQAQLSKKIYYDYLVENRLTRATFDEFFPKDDDEHSLIQSFLVDVRSYMSDKTQLLRVGCEFAAGQSSPKNMQIVVISIHPNGSANVRRIGDSNFSWEWEFMQPV